MKTTRRDFLQASAMASLVAAAPASSVAGVPRASSIADDKELDGYELAKYHIFVRTKPGPTYFEGLLLGNGDIGVCAVVRPDALGLYISKSDCWDIRVTEESEKEVRPFSEILEMWKRASVELKEKGSYDGQSVEDAAFFREYSNRVGASYSKPWPRPWPCGTVWLKWDPRWVEPITYSLNPANGVFTLELKIQPFRDAERRVKLTVLVDWETGCLTIDSDSIPEISVIYAPATDGLTASPFGGENITVRPDQLPRPELSRRVGAEACEFSCFQYLPAIGPSKENPNPPRSDRDRNFALHGYIEGAWSVSRIESNGSIVFSVKSNERLRLSIAVATPRDILLRRRELEGNSGHDPASWITISQDHVYSMQDRDTPAFVEKLAVSSAKQPFAQQQQASEAHWRAFWSASAVRFQDEALERIWYHNQYFLACCLRKYRTAPGLFANWSYEGIGTAWHSDYHLDYNCQQVYWGVFSSNRIDMHQPYLELVENLLPMSEKFAQESFKLAGAFFPLSAYPVPSQIVPYPALPWGYQICMTPWAVQSLWWQYLYTQDQQYLRRVYPIMRSAASFLAGYVTKEADGRYHIFPSISSENWGCTVDFKLNKDCILDLALTRFLLNAMVEASMILSQDDADRILWKEISDNLAPYPMATGPHGEVWIDIQNASTEHVYNVPITLAPVFPGEQVGIDKGMESLDLATRTARTMRLEGGNDLVSQPLIRARLGMLDLDWFKGQIEYCMLPNGVSNDRVRQTGGRYSMSTDLDFMMRMGLWCENFAVPVVLNECMLQSYSGTIRLFPNVLNLGPARFEKLRAVGAFLVSAAYDGKTVTKFEVHSEKGVPLRFVSPWPQESVRVTRVRDGKRLDPQRQGDSWIVPTEPGERYSVTDA